MPEPDLTIEGFKTALGLRGAEYLQKMVDTLEQAAKAESIEEKHALLSLAVHHMLTWALQAEKRLPMFPGLGF